MALGSGRRLGDAESPLLGGDTTVGHDTIMDGTTWTTWTTANSGPPNDQLGPLAVDAAGRVWIGVSEEGVAVLTPSP